MREIKFRGKQVDSGRWVYGSYINEPSGVVIQEYNTVRIKTTVNPYTIGQYINIHDKEDTPLYEGDIIKIFTDKWIIAVVNIEFGIPIFTSSDFTDSYENVSEFLQTDGDYGWVDCELVGNIHDRA